MANRGEFAMREIQAQVEFDLVITRLHEFAQPIKRLVVIAFLQMRKFMHDDHAQEFGRRFLEQRRNRGSPFSP